ncbi:MAG: class I SAM-dependent methyltransferase [Tepidisphaeraceae bacterium]
MMSMSDSRRDAVRKIIEEHYQRNDPLGWFEAVYQNAQGQGEQIPWFDGQPNRHMTEWLDRQGIPATGRALVVGCGTGDDAEELHRRGFTVVAFDISRTAIDWCRKRFPESSVDYVAADLFDAPHEWAGAFDFVFEAYTLQALPRSLRGRAIRNIGRFVAPRARLLLICRGREDGEEEGSLPWPLTREEVASFESYGLRLTSFENYIEDRDGPIRRFRAVFERPA